MARIIAIRPEIVQLSSKQVAIDYGGRGPFLTLTPQQVRGLINALADAGWITVGGQALRPKL